MPPSPHVLIAHFVERDVAAAAEASDRRLGGVLRTSAPSGPPRPAHGGAARPID